MAFSSASEHMPYKADWASSKVNCTPYGRPCLLQKCASNIDTAFRGRVCWHGFIS